MKTRLSRNIIITAAAALVSIILIISGISLRYLVGFLFFIILMVIFIIKPLYFLIALFLFRSALDNYFISIRIYLGGVDIGLGGIVALSLFVGTVYHILISKKINRLQHIIVLLYFAFCLISILSFSISPDKIGAIKALVGRFSIFSILALTIININTRRDAQLLLKAIILSAIIPLVSGSVTYITEGGRVSGTFSHPNIFAFYLLVIVGCVLIQVDSSQQYTGFSFWKILYVGVLFTGLLLTLTRSAWASCVLMLSIYVLFFKRRWIIPVICVFLVISTLPIVQGRILESFNPYSGSLSVKKVSSLGWRIDIWHYFYEEAIKKPLSGYGINAATYLEGYNVHNDYLRLFMESGLIGLMLYFGSYIYIMVHSLRNYALFKKDGYRKRLATYFICFVPAFLLMSTTENLADYLTVQWYIWGLAGIYYGLMNLKKENTEIR